jgi:hypothetical protein
LEAHKEFKELSELPWMVHLGKNESKFQSIKLVFSRVWLYAPSSIWWLLRPYLNMLVLAVIFIPINLVIWIAATVFLTFAGLFGFIKPGGATLKAE